MENQIEAKAGDIVRVRFTNNLSQPTNLHYHGLHVTPTGNADNAFLDIPSGESLTCEFTLPKNHPSGTFWYHPHRHGFVTDSTSQPHGNDEGTRRTANDS